MARPRWKFWIRTCLATVALLAASVLVAPPASAAPLCALDTFAKKLAVTNQGSGIYIRASNGYLIVSDVTCALLNQVDTVSIDMVNEADFLDFSLSGGPLGPGATDEGNGSSEIEFEVRNLSPNGRLAVFATSGPDGLRAGQRFSLETGIVGHVNINSLVDGATQDVDILVFGTFPGSLTFDGHEGDDILSGAGAGPLVSSAYTGRMLIAQGTGTDQVTGGNSDDTFLSTDGALTTTEPDTFIGGPGLDTYEANESGAATASYSLDGVANDGKYCPGGSCEGDNLSPDIESIVGSSMSDQIIGTAGRQILDGGPGNDVVIGGPGNDLLTGGGNADTLLGGGGRDRLVNSSGSDVMSGGGGFDTVSYADSEMPISASLNAEANDGYFGEGDYVQPDIERVVGSVFADVFQGNADANEFAGAEGDDMFWGRGGDDTLLGQGGNDTFDGGAGSDRCAQGTGVGNKVNCES